MGRIDGREGLGMSPTFTSSPTCGHKHGGKKFKLARWELDLQEGSKEKAKPVKGQMKDTQAQEKRRKGECCSGLQKEAKQEVKKKMEG